MAKRILKVGVIGCGAFAEGMDFPNFKANPNVAVQWCCDTAESRAKAMAGKFGVPRWTTTYQDVLDDPEIDMIKISTTHEIHWPIIELAAKRHKHVFCEKPMALEETDALKIIGAVRRSGIKLCVDTNRRMAPSLHALKRRWQEHVRAPKHQPWRYVEIQRDLFPEEKRTQFLVRIQDESYSYRLVHLDPLRGGGEIIGESVHWLDLACWWFHPQIPVEIQAFGSTRFSHGIHVTFSEGDTATILFHCGGTFDYPKELYEVTAYGALFRNNIFVENEYYGVPGLDREQFPLMVDTLSNIGTEGGLSGYLKKYSAMVKGEGNSKQRMGSVVVDKGHRAMCDAFVDAILNDQPSPCDEIAGYLSVYLARMAIRSIELRQAMKIPLERVVFNVI